MEHGEVTPEFVTTAVNNFGDTYESIVRFATEHFTSQFERTVQFYKELDDRCIAAGIANFDDQSDTSMKVFEVEFNVWQMTMLRCKDTIAKELDYLRSQCVCEKDEEDPRAQFLSRVEPFEDGITETATVRFMDMIKESMRYRDDERNELLTRSQEHIQTTYEWAKDLMDKVENDRKAGMNESDLKWIEEKMKKGRMEESFENVLEKGKEEFTTYLEKSLDAKKLSIDTISANCIELIDLSIEYGTHDSGKFIDDATQMEHFDTELFSRSAMEYLERVSARMATAFSQIGSDNISLTRISFDAAKKEMKEALDVTIESIRSMVVSNNENLTSHKSEARKAVDLEFRKLSASEKDSDIAAMKKLAEEFPFIDISPYNKVELGRGGEGTIYRCTLPGTLLKSNADMVTVACKKFEGTFGTDELISRSYLKHINFTQFLGRGIMGNHHFLIMEMCPYSLDDKIDICREEGTFLGVHDVLKWGMELISGMNFLHDLGVSHGDLKPPNIMIGENNELKITDFGLSLRTHTFRDDSKKTHTKGTARYMAPELHNRTKMSAVDMRRCDVWSFGVCLWEMISCQIPFGNCSEEAISVIIGRNDSKSHPPLPSQQHCESLSNLLRNCWNPVLEHRWPFYRLESKFVDVKREIEEEMIDDCDDWNQECEAWATAKHNRPFTCIKISRRHSL